MAGWDWNNGCCHYLDGIGLAPKPAVEEIAPQANDMVTQPKEQAAQPAQEAIMSFLSRLSLMGILLVLAACMTNHVVQTATPQDMPVNTPATSATIVIAPSPTSSLPPATVSPGKTITIALKPLTQTRQLSYEDDHVKITLGYDEFMARLDQVQGLEGAPQTKQLLQDYEVARQVNLREPDVWYIHKHILVGLLQSGLVSVYDKQSESYVTSIKMRTYKITYGFDWAEGHLAFYLADGTLILDILTWLT